MYKINNLVIFLLVVIFANEIRADVVENSFDFNFGGIMMQGEEEEETKRIVLETQFPQDVPMSYPATMLAFYVDKLSGGKMEVVINPNGEPLSKFPYALPKADQFKRVVKGIDSHILLGEPSSWPTGNAKYFFQGIPFGLSGDEQDIWMQQHGGQELMDDHYRKHGIRAFPAGNTGAYAGGFFKEALDEEQDSLNQARGTFFEKSSVAEDLYSLLNAEIMKDRRWLSDSGIKRTSIGEWSVNSMPWQDTGLEVGAIENDWTYYYPGLHQPNKMLTFAVNTRALNALEENQQEILKAAMSIVHHRASVMFADKNREALRSFEQKGLDIRSFPDPLVNNAIKATSTVMNSYIENDDEAKSVWFSLRSRFTAINESH